MAKKGGLGSILGDIGGAYLGDQFGSKFGLSPQMGAALGGAAGGALGGGGWAGAAEGGLGGYFGGDMLHKGLNSAFSNIGGLFGGRGGTGSSPIMAGGPGAMPAVGAAGAAAIPDMLAAGDPGVASPTLDPNQINEILAGGGGGFTPGSVPDISGSLGPGDLGGGGVGGAAHGVMDKIMGGFRQNPMAALGLLGGVYQGLTPSPYSGELKALAKQEQGLSKTYGDMTLGALQGKLPAEAESYVQQMIRAQKARVTSTYANMGMSGSTAEADDLNAVEASAEGLRMQIGQGMASTSGNIMEGMSQGASQLYGALMQDSLQRGEALGQDLAAYGAAFAKPQYQYINGQWVLVPGQG